MAVGSRRLWGSGRRGGDERDGVVCGFGLVLGRCVLV